MALSANPFFSSTPSPPHHHSTSSSPPCTLVAPNPTIFTFTSSSSSNPLLPSPLQNRGKNDPLAAAPYASRRTKWGGVHAAHRADYETSNGRYQNGNGHAINGHHTSYNHSNGHATNEAEWKDNMGNKLVVGVVGFGNFGQFLAKRIVEQGHSVIAHSRSDYGDTARQVGASFFRDLDKFCEQRPEVILLCSSIISTKSILSSMPLHLLSRDTLFVDVLSVKEYPRNLFVQLLPSKFDILCTHPMFGPQTGTTSWNGLPFVYDKVRIGEGNRSDRCDKFLNIFRNEGCRLVEMSCAEHDRYAAGSQFVTHTVGRILGNMGLESTPINTKGYEQILQLVKHTNSISFDLYYGLFMYNQNSMEQLEKLELALKTVKKQLLDREELEKSCGLTEKNVEINA